MTAESAVKGSVQQIAAAAWTYCARLDETPADVRHHALALDASLHDLQLVCGFDRCEPGTCPGMIS